MTSTVPFLACRKTFFFVFSRHDYRRAIHQFHRQTRRNFLSLRRAQKYDLVNVLAVKVNQACTRRLRKELPSASIDFHLSPTNEIRKLRLHKSRPAIIKYSHDVAIDLLSTNPKGSRRFCSFFFRIYRIYPRTEKSK